MRTKLLIAVLAVATGCRASNKEETYGTASPAPGSVAPSPEAVYSTPPEATAMNEPIAVDVVSVDPVANRLVVRAVVVPPPEGVARTSQKSRNQKSVKVDPALNDTLRTLKAGEAVTITCGDVPVATGAAPRTSTPITTLVECEYVTLITPGTAAAGTTRPGAVPQ